MTYIRESSERTDEGRDVGSAEGLAEGSGVGLPDGIDVGKAVGGDEGSGDGRALGSSCERKEKERSNKDDENYYDICEE